MNMREKMISSNFQISDADISFFRKHGFLKLKQVFAKEAISHMAMISRDAVAAPSNNYGAGFSRLKYDIGNDDDFILNLISDERLSSALTTLCNRDLFFTQGLAFELEKNKSTGFPWHVGTQSFGFQHIDDFGCTIWTPLCRIDSKGQRGGMAYIPKDILSGAFIYQHINMLPAFMKHRIEAGDPYNFHGFSALKNDLLNSKEMSDLLDFHAVEDDFEPGDAFLFDKYVLHRSVRLDEGPIGSRLAYALRFSAVDAAFDKKRVEALAYPRGLFNYDVASNFNEIVCAEDGERIIDSPYFERSREQRTLSRERKIAIA
jgi:hypothetical protein